MDVALTILCAAVVLFVPGFLLMRALGMPRGTSLCAAPAMGVAFYTLLGEVNHLLGVASGPLTLLVGPSVMLGAVAVWRSLRERGTEPSGISVAAALRYAAIGLAAFWIIFYRRIPFDALLMEYYDNVFHFNNVRAIAESGDYSLLHALRYYATPADVKIAPWPASSSFYPYGWHFVCALVLQMSSKSMALASNAVNYVMCGAVFPLGMALLNEAVTPDDPHARLAGSLVATAATGFPWMLVLLWPLFPNSLGLALVPATAGLFVVGVRDKSGREKMLYALVFALSLIGVAATHPNAVFTLLVLIFPFLGGRILAGQGITFRGRHLSRWTLAALYCVACGCVWLLLYLSPAFQGIVDYNWGTDLSLTDGLHDVLTMGYMYHMDLDEPQYLLTALAVIGCISALKAKSGRWTIGAFALASTILYGELVLSSENVLKHLLAGFWYTDPYRVAASTTICVLPLVTLGLAACLRWFDRVVLHADAQTAGENPWRRRIPLEALSALFLVVIYFPQIPALYERGYQTSFGDYRMLADIITARKDVLDHGEIAFLTKVNDVVPHDAVVINYPFDGSNFAYGALGTRVLYRYIGGYDQSPEQETLASRLCRTRLDRVATDEVVRSALRELGDCYFLRLESTYAPDENGQGNYLGAPFSYPAWEGMLSVSDETPGFTLVLAEGPFRLYHIDL